MNLISSHPPAVDDPEVFYLQDTSSRLFLFVFASSDFLFLSFLKFFSFKNSWESSRCVNDEMHTFLILYVANVAISKTVIAGPDNLMFLFCFDLSESSFLFA